MTTINFSSLEDVIVPTNNGVTYRGLGGPDIYVLSDAIKANAKISIVDTTGSNKIGMTYLRTVGDEVGDLDEQMSTPNFRTTIRSYTGSAKAVQYSKNGNPIKAYNFVDIYPVTLTDIALSWDSTNQVEEYSCTFDYQYFETSYDEVIPSEKITYNSGSDYYKNNIS